MNNLPTPFKKYFWDCDFTLLDKDKHKEFILKRLLTFGDLEVIRYILMQDLQLEILDFLNKKGQDTLSRTNYLFWQKLVKHNELWR